jgi:hypothetical protein
VFFTRPTAWGTRKNGYIHGEKRKRKVKEKGRKIKDKINEIKKTGKTEKNKWKSKRINKCIN